MSSPIIQTLHSQELETEPNKKFQSFVTSMLHELKERIAALEKKSVQSKELTQLKNVILKLENTNK
ncbi:hypothetical protein ODX41_02280, partial [Salmonella enterica subsp. enterica serovar Enteritidis]|uniref:hypothetical protein n=1 Tax=Salmonella enterica TaxID=28901 RepID=UPI0032E4EFE7